MDKERIIGREEIYKERIIGSSGNLITLTNQGSHLQKPWQVACYDSEEECRWVRDFVTQEEAEKEYIRWD